MEKDTTHYVVNVTVQRVDIGKTRTNLAAPERTVTELARHVIRADKLTDVIERVKQHIDLVDDVSAVDPIDARKTSTR